MSQQLVPVVDEPESHPRPRRGPAPYLIGRHHIQICKTLSCKIVGEPEITEHICGKLGIHPGETTPDGKFTVTMVECLGSCGTAPMMQIGFDYHENLTREKVDQILASLD